MNAATTIANRSSKMSILRLHTASYLDTSRLAASGYTNKFISSFVTKRSHTQPYYQRRFPFPTEQ